ncbi:MAG: diaminopimelate decarboxylase [Betaproteobacteria bacterium]
MILRGTARVNARNHLEIGGCDAVELARRFGTPLYVLDEELVRSNCRAYREAFSGAGGVVLYAAKTFLTRGMARLVDEEGLGLDVVSGGELYTALSADFPPERIYFNGNNKSPAELEEALAVRIGGIIVDNSSELELLSDLAARQKERVTILLRIAPGVQAHTHEYIQTGQVDSKFGFPLVGGIALEGVRRALADPWLDLRGYHCHIGSQILALGSYRVAVRAMLDFAAEARAITGYCPEILDLGGGLGVRYTADDDPPTIRELGQVILTTVAEEAEARGLPCPRLFVEPGRSIVGEAGTTLYTVGAVKDIPGVRKYVAVDGGMTDNPRVALYQAVYEAMVANRAADAPSEVVSVAGKCCESGDMLLWEIALPPVERGDFLAVFTTGAYNYSMASNYNRLPRPAVVLVRNGQARLLVARETYADLVRLDLIPEDFARPGEKRLPAAGQAP